MAKGRKSYIGSFIGSADAGFHNLLAYPPHSVLAWMHGRQWHIGFDSLYMLMGEIWAFFSFSFRTR